MRTKQRAEIACGRRAMLAELGIADGPGRARRQSAGYGCQCPECETAQWDMRRLKHWMCGRLLAYGAEVAEVDRRVDGLPVDIYWRKGDSEFVIEVRSGSLERALAQEHTERLRAAGIRDVLWLCPPGYWVDYLHALGIADFAPPACDYQAVSGLLDTANSAVAGPRKDPTELRDFIEGWVTGDIVWGYREVMTGGWATVADWEYHTKTQATIIARQRQELVNQRTALALSRKTVRDKQKNLMKLTTRLERAEQEAQDRADSLAQARRKLDDHHRVDTSLRATIKSMQQTINHWQLMMCCAMMLIITFVAGAMVVR
ncbi:hypothetical protein [Nocardia altamirensis]|uniref:hypothetical protein n=1 Tax=Nocardia altamirensis TaxID=472158 RepID=UPI000B0BCF78|nr:hypothetical protein [Nocardia altamirensis]